MSSKEAIEKRLLERRAEELGVPIAEQEYGESIPLLEFFIMGNRYAVNLEKVETVTRIGDIVTIPTSLNHISGIIRRRGQSIALVNLRRFFYSGAEGIADADFAVIVNAGGKRFALQVEEILGVIHLPADLVMSTPENFDPAQATHISGVTIDGLSVINLETLVKARGFGTDESAG